MCVERAVGNKGLRKGENKAIFNSLSNKSTVTRKGRHRRSYYEVTIVDTGTESSQDELSFLPGPLLG
ncbi:hypothetical protein KM043_007223 [Ampulex compressa]|nr:hypothetical protein KM043_007223 [Ampulex compressa]